MLYFSVVRFLNGAVFAFSNHNFIFKCLVNKKITGMVKIKISFLNEERNCLVLA